jgi:membrane protein
VTPDPRGTADATGDPGARGPGSPEHPAAHAFDPFAAVGRLIERVLGWGPIPRIRFVFDAYGNAGGGILASGLAFGALFSLIPATLLILGVTGFFIADADVRADLVRRIAAMIPPLEDFFTLALDQLAAGAIVFSIVGLIGFAWTASQFYGQLDHAFALIFHSRTRRDPIERTIRGLLAVGLIIALFILLLGVSLLTTDPSNVVSRAVNQVLGWVGPLLGIVLVPASVALIYRVVPTEFIPWRAIVAPTIAVAILGGLLTILYVFLAPYLASPRIFGAFFTVFATLAWLSWTFQILLIGAAWTREQAFGIVHAPGEFVAPSQTPEAASNSTPDPGRSSTVDQP